MLSTIGAILSMFAGSVHGQSAGAQLDPTKLSALQPAMQSFIDQHAIAWAVTLVASREGVLDVETFGQADIAENAPMKPVTLFWIASMTKPITASAILMLQDEGKLSVDDLVAKYLLMAPRANFPNSDASPVRKAFQDAAAAALR